MEILQRYEKMFRSLVPENLKKQLKKEKGTLGDGAKNLVLASLVVAAMMLVAVGVQMMFFGSISLLKGSPLEAAGGTTLALVYTVLIAIAIPVLVVISSLISTAIMWALAKLLGGTGTFTQQFFQFSYPVGGIMIISAVVGIVPCLGDLVSFALSIYSFYIAFLIYRSVHNLSDTNAIILVLMPIVLLIVLMVIAFVLFAGLIASLITGAAGLGAYYS